MIDMRLGDCMDLMRAAPDGHWDLAVVDPPYGITADKRGDLGIVDPRGVRSKASRLHKSLTSAGKLKDRILNRMGSSWDAFPPPVEYFEELRRVSKNQIIWGGNYFDLGPTRCVVCWDKEQPWENFSQWEMAWTSFDSPASLFRLSNAGPGEQGKIHPTQKPVALYKWLLTRYAKPGWKILDTHGGSGSSCIATHDLGFDLTWIEKDLDYYEAAVKRYQTHASQLPLFEPEPERKPEQGNLI